MPVGMYIWLYKFFVRFIMHIAWASALLVRQDGQCESLQRGRARNSATAHAFFINSFLEKFPSERQG